MSESISFWLEQRNSAGTKMAVIGDQILVLYRERYYVVKDGAALTRGGKTLRYSGTSLPSSWKRALKGEVIQPVSMSSALESALTVHQPKRERKKMEINIKPEVQQEAKPDKIGKAPILGANNLKKTVSKTATQPPVGANCPYCNARHDIPVEKGKNGKPFFMSCNKCKKEFAVRLVPVTVFQAEVAGFR